MGKKINFYISYAILKIIYEASKKVIERIRGYLIRR